MHKAGFIEEPGLDRTFGYYRILGLFQSQHGHTSRRSKRSWGEASLRVTGSTIKRISALTSAWAEFVLAFTAGRRWQKTCTAVKKWLRELRPCCVFTTKARPHSWKIWEVWYLCGSSERNQDRNSLSEAFLWHQELKGNTFAQRYAATWKRLGTKLLWARGRGNSTWGTGSRTHRCFSHTNKFKDSVIITIILQYDPKRNKAALELPQKEHLSLLVCWCFWLWCGWIWHIHVWINVHCPFSLIINIILPQITNLSHFAQQWKAAMVKYTGRRLWFLFKFWNITIYFHPWDSKDEIFFSLLMFGFLLFI